MKKVSKENTNLKKEVKEKEGSIIILDKNVSTEPLKEVVDSQRNGLLTLYRKTQRYSNIMMVVAVTIFVASIIMLAQKIAALTIVAYCLIALCIVGMVVFYVVTRNLYPNASKKYFKVFWKATNDYIFSDLKFTECQIDTNTKYVISDVLADRAYKDVVDSASRNIVKGKYNEQPFTFGELAYYKAGAKKNAKDVLFVGRRLEMMNDLHFDGRYIINIRSTKSMDLPTDIDDLTVLKDENGLVIYGPQDGKIEKDLGKDILKSIEHIRCIEPLLNVNFVFWPGHSIVYMSYDDSIVAIPFDKPINVKSYESLKNDVMDVFAIVARK